jgi:hypothetical protein
VGAAEVGGAGGVSDGAGTGAVGASGATLCGGATGCEDASFGCATAEKARLEASARHAGA